MKNSLIPGEFQINVFMCSCQLVISLHKFRMFHRCLSEKETKKVSGNEDPKRRQQFKKRQWTNQLGELLDCLKSSSRETHSCVSVAYINGALNFHLPSQETIEDPSRVFSLSTSSFWNFTGKILTSSVYEWTRTELIASIPQIQHCCEYIPKPAMAHLPDPHSHSFLSNITKSPFPSSSWLTGTSPFIFIFNFSFLITGAQ